LDQEETMQSVECSQQPSDLPEVSEAVRELTEDRSATLRSADIAAWVV
jgi:hypothetical protein